MVLVIGVFWGVLYDPRLAPKTLKSSSYRQQQSSSHSCVHPGGLCTSLCPPATCTMYGHSASSRILSYSVRYSKNACCTTAMKIKASSYTHTHTHTTPHTCTHTHHTPHTHTHTHTHTTHTHTFYLLIFSEKSHKSDSDLPDLKDKG